LHFLKDAPAGERSLSIFTDLAANFRYSSAGIPEKAITTADATAMDVPIHADMYEDIPGARREKKYVVKKNRKKRYMIRHVIK